MRRGGSRCEAARRRHAAGLTPEQTERRALDRFRDRVGEADADGAGMDVDVAPVLLHGVYDDRVGAVVAGGMRRALDGAMGLGRGTADAGTHVPPAPPPPPRQPLPPPL